MQRLGIDVGSGSPELAFDMRPDLLCVKRNIDPALSEALWLVRICNC